MAKVKNKIQIDCIGDSITSGIKAPSYPRILHDLFQQDGIDNVQVNNRGKEGFTVGDYLSFLHDEPNASLLQKRNIDVILLLLGSNDTRDTVNTPLDEFETTYRKLIALLQTKTQNIYLMNIPSYKAPVKIFWKGQNHIFDAVERITGELNPKLMQIADEMRLRTIDIYSPLKAKEDEIYLDGIHPNPTGNKIIAETCYQSIQSTVSIATTE